MYNSREIMVLLADYSVMSFKYHAYITAAEDLSEEVLSVSSYMEKAKFKAMKSQIPTIR